MTLRFDAHVHAHPDADLDRVSEAIVGACEGPLVLCLVETARGGEYDRVRAHADWIELDEPGSLKLRHGDVWMVYGRQCVSSERLEVLAIGLDPATTVPDDDARTTRDLVEVVLDTEALAVLPWGVGKWWGRRGTIVRRLVGSTTLQSSSRFFLGDIAARARRTPAPLPFRAPIRVLVGSDPLPLRGSDRQIGSYLNEIEATFDPARPRRSLVSALAGGAAVAHRGRPLPKRVAVIDQFRLRVGG